MAELRPDGSDRFQVDLDEEYPVLERKYEYKRRVRWLARAGGLSPRSAFEDIACCPVCTQDKPAGEWTLREILHMQKHVQSPVVEYIEIHCVHTLHGFRICCRCLQYPKWEGKIWTIGGELFVSSN